MANVPKASAENSTPSLSSRVIITSGQCTIGAVMNRSDVRPRQSVSPSATVCMRSSKSVSSKYSRSIVAALAVHTSFISGYRAISRLMEPEWSGSMCCTIR